MFVETKWYEINSEKLNEILQAYHLQNLPPQSLTIQSPIEIGVNIYCNSDTICNEFAEIHKCEPHETNCQIYGKLYVKCGLDKEELKKFGIDSNIPEKYIGLFDPSTCTALFWSEEKYGFIKSVAFGLCSYLCLDLEYLPVHGAFVKVNGQNVVFFGGHKAGKTTLVSNLQNSQFGRDLMIATDDWLLTKPDTSFNIHGFAVENFLSFEEGRFKHIDLNTCLYSHTSKKYYIHKQSPNAHLSVFDEGTIEKWVWLNPHGSGTVPVDHKAMAKALSDSCYHMPLTRNIRLHINSCWEKILNSGKDLYALDVFSTSVSFDKKLSKLLCN